MNFLCRVFLLGCFVGLSSCNPRYSYDPEDSLEEVTIVAPAQGTQSSKLQTTSILRSKHENESQKKTVALVQKPRLKTSHASKPAQRAAPQPVYQERTTKVPTTPLPIVKEALPAKPFVPDRPSYIPIDEERALLTGQKSIFEKQWEKEHRKGALEIDPRDRFQQKGITSEDRDWLNGKRRQDDFREQENPINFALKTTTKALNSAYNQR